MVEQVISSRSIFKGKILTLREDTVLLDNGETARREVVEHVDSVGIIALDTSDSLLLVDQFRLPAGKMLLEIPAGCVEPGEEAHATVIRELREETGYSPGVVKRLGGFYLAPGYATEYMHIFLAQELEYAPLTAEDTEGIEIIREPLCHVNKLISSGRIQDCKSIAAMLMYLQSTRV
ncbi:MAG: NUDIX hydrolase [Dehalococcoidaceae bacterium]|nr:NUDIX hydrolase [Dehalococcoidaceae bacterium]